MKQGRGRKDAVEKALSAQAEQILRLKERIRSMPGLPGVYRWLDKRGTVLYVGKAKDLKKRLQSYVRDGMVDIKPGLVDKMWDVDITVTSSELEALELEMHLIRTLKPRYNVALKRDRSVGYVRIAVHEDFPSVLVVHRRERDGAKYFGPFSSPRYQYHVLGLLRTIFPFRDCQMGLEMRPTMDFAVTTVGGAEPRRLELSITQPDRRTPCFDYHIARCSGPCTGDLSPDEYRVRCIDGIVDFYEGKVEAVMNALVSRMKAASGERKFERARDILDVLDFVSRLQKQRPLFKLGGRSTDAFGLEEADGVWQICALQIRSGSLVNEVKMQIPADGSPPDTVLAQFLPQYYATADVPEQIVLGHALPDQALLQIWLRKQADREVSLKTPKRGEARRLVELAHQNARIKLHVRQVKKNVGDAVGEGQMALF